jgi:hypothetical protein
MDRQVPKIELSHAHEYTNFMNVMRHSEVDYLINFKIKNAL